MNSQDLVPDPGPPAHGHLPHTPGLPHLDTASSATPWPILIISSIRRDGDDASTRLGGTAQRRESRRAQARSCALPGLQRPTPTPLPRSPQTRTHPEQVHNKPPVAPSIFSSVTAPDCTLSPSTLSLHPLMPSPHTSCLLRHAPAPPHSPQSLAVLHAGQV